MKFSNLSIKKICVYLIATACIIWVVKGVRFDDVFVQIREMHLWWLLPAVFLDIFTTVCHGFRWRLLLQPIGSVTLLRSVQAIYTALFTNEILPVKAGEFVRGYLLSRWLRTSFASILPSMIAERVFDGSLLLIGFIVSTYFITLPPEIVTAAVIVGTALFLTIAMLAVLVIRAKRSSRNHIQEPGKRSRAVQHIATFFSQFVSGLRLIRTFMQFFSVLTATILYFFSQVLAYWLVMKAYGFHFPFWVPAVVLIMVRLGTALPNAPANIGPLQFFCVLALMLFGVEKTAATGFAIILWLVFSIPIFILGSVCFLRSGLSLSEIREGKSQEIIR